MEDITRRNAAKGLAWSVPVISIVAAAPAFAASTSGTLIYRFDGGGGANGYPLTAYLNIRSTTGQTIVLAEPMVLTIDVVGLNLNTTEERSFTPVTSYGTISGRTYNPATRTTTFTWTVSAGTSISPLGTSGSYPDLRFSFGSGLTAGGVNGRITNKIVVRSITGYPTPPLTPIDSSVVKDIGGVSPDGIY